MTLPKLRFLPATVALVALLFSTPSRSFADSYQITGLGIDNTQFYGMDDSGHVVLYASFFSCGNPATGCYETFLNGTPLANSSVVPPYTWDFVPGTCVSPQPFSSPCSITHDGRTATITKGPPGVEDLYASVGANPPQLLATTGFGGIFAIDGLGDIVFDDGTLDEWYEAVDLTTTATIPEPASFLLLATGLLGFASLRRAVPQN